MYHSPTPEPTIIVFFERMGLLGRKPGWVGISTPITSPTDLRELQNHLDATAGGTHTVTGWRFCDNKPIWSTTIPGPIKPRSGDDR